MMAYELRGWTTFYFLSLTFIFKALADPQSVAIGGLFDNIFSQEHGALRHSLYQHNIHINDSNTQVYVKADIKNYELVDIFGLGESLCGLFNFDGGIYVVVGVSTSTLMPTIKSYSNRFNIPYITPSLSGTGLLSNETDFQLYLRPSPIPVLAELILSHRWDSLHYMYDDLEGLYRLERLLEVAVDRNFNVYPLHMREAENVRPFLRKVIASQQLHIVIDTSSIDRTETVLTQALQLGMVTDKYHFIVLDFDMKNINLENFTYGGVNITGLDMVNESDPRYGDFRNTWLDITNKYSGRVPHIGYIKFQAVLIYDSLSVIAEAFKLMHADNVVISSKATQCDSHHLKQWSDGKKFLHYLKQVDTHGLTGRIQFDANGRRKNYSINLLSLVRDPDSNRTKLSKTRTWNSSVSKELSVGKDGEIHRPRGDNANKTYIITTIESAPYYMKKKNEDDFTRLQDKYEGYCKDLMKAIAERLNIKYEFRLVKDGKYGGYKEGIGWDGMIREVMDEVADLAVAPLTITSQREHVVEFTTPFMNLGISIMIKKPQNTKPGVFSFLHPLSHEIWMCIVVAYVGVSVVLFLVSRFSPYEWHTVDAPPPMFGDSGDRQEMANDFGIFNSLWFSLGAFMQQGCDISPRSLSGRIVGGVWWFFTLIIISSYTANLAAFLTVERMISPIESADDLSKQTEIAYGTVKSGSTLDFFRTTNVDVYERMWSYMSTAEDVFVDTIGLGIDKVRSSKGKYALLLESTMNDFINQRKPCDTIRVGDNLNSRGYGIAMKKGFPRKEDLTLAILRLREDGVLHNLEQTWWFEKGECGPPDAKSQETANELSLSNVAGVFYILVGGLGLAMFVALLEFCYKSRKEARKAKTSLSIAMRAKARMSIKGDSVNEYAPEYTKALSTVPISRTNNGGSGNPFARKSLTHSPSEEDLLAKGKMEEIYLKERSTPQNYFDHTRIKGKSASRFQHP